MAVDLPPVPAKSPYLSFPKNLSGGNDGDLIDVWSENAVCPGPPKRDGKRAGKLSVAVGAGTS